MGSGAEQDLDMLLEADEEELADITRAVEAIEVRCPVQAARHLASTRACISVFPCISVQADLLRMFMQGVRKPTVKKFKRELAKLRGKGEVFP